MSQHPDERVEVVAADAVETVEIEDDGTVVDVVETEVVEAVRDAEGEVVEVVDTHVVDTEVIDPDGTIVEVVETETVDARLEGDEVVVTGTVDVDLVESALVEVDGPDSTDDLADVDDDPTVVLDDDAADTRLEALDDGSAAVAGAEAIVGSPEALPFEMPARERFASLDDIEATGDARVDAATARLEEVPDLPTTDHVGVYEDVHRRLQEALSDTEVR